MGQGEMIEKYHPALCNGYFHINFFNCFSSPATVYDNIEIIVLIWHCATVNHQFQLVKSQLAPQQPTPDASASAELKLT